MKTSTERNQLVRVAELARAVAADELPAYSCPKSPRRFTEPQPARLLGVAGICEADVPRGGRPLGASNDLRRVLALTRVPDYSTLQRFADRAVTPALLDRVLGRLIERAGPVVEELAMDTTGMELSNASAYYTARRGTRHKGYVKLSVVIVCGGLLPLTLVVSRGPRLARVVAEEGLGKASGKARPRRLSADAG